MDFYNSIAKGYDRLYGEEQEAKLKIIKDNLDIKITDLLLDVGCGTGISSRFNCKVVGIDPSIELMHQGKNSSKMHRGCKKILARAENLPFKSKVFDKVVSVTSMHNFDDLEKGIKEIKRVGKGDFAFSILKKTKYFEFIEKEIKNNFSVKKNIDAKQDCIFICGISTKLTKP